MLQKTELSAGTAGLPGLYAEFTLTLPYLVIFNQILPSEKQHKTFEESCMLENHVLKKKRIPTATVVKRKSLLSTSH